MSFFNVAFSTYNINESGALGTSQNTIPTEFVIEAAIASAAGINNITAISTVPNANALSISGSDLTAHTASDTTFGVLQGITTATHTAFGTNVGPVPTGTGTNNVVLATGSVSPAIVNGSNNLVVGPGCGDGLTNANNNIVLGINSGDNMTDAGVESNILLGENVHIANAASSFSCVIGRNHTETNNTTIAFAGYTHIRVPQLGDHTATRVVTFDPGSNYMRTNLTPVVWTTDSIDALADVDTTTTPPVANDILTYDGSDWVPQAPSSGTGIFNITAERNNSVETGDNFAFGNGSSASSVSVVIRIDCNLVGISVNSSDTTGTQEIAAVINGVTSPTARTGVYSATTINASFAPVAISAGDRVGFICTDGGLLGNSWNNVQVAGWFEYDIGGSGGGGGVNNLVDLDDVEITGIAAGQTMQWDGTDMVIADSTRIGTVVGSGQGQVQGFTSYAGDGYIETPWLYTGGIQQEGTRSVIGSQTYLNMSVDNNIFIATSNSIQASIDDAGIFLGNFSYVKCSNLVFGAPPASNDLNPIPPGAAEVQLTGNSDILGQFSISGNGIVCLFDGVVQIMVNVHVESAGTRNSVQMRLQRTRSAVTTDLGPIMGTGYIRNNTGHTEASFHMTTIEQVEEDDEFRVLSRRAGTNATDTYLSAAATSSFEMIRIGRSMLPVS